MAFALFGSSPLKQRIGLRSAMGFRECCETLLFW